MKKLLFNNAEQTQLYKMYNKTTMFWEWFNKQIVLMLHADRDEEANTDTVIVSQ